MSLATRLSDLAYAIGTDMKLFRVWMTGSSTGDLNGLTTSDKSNFVAAINEIKAGSSGAPPDATTVSKGLVELAELSEVTDGISGSLVVTVAGVRQERLALKEEILGIGVPEALDTLDELAAALGDNANFAGEMTTLLAGKVDATDIGLVDTDLVAVYESAKA